MHISPAPTPPDYLRLYESEEVMVAATPRHVYKTTNYLDNILARRAALAAGADEAIMLNQHGRVAAAAAGNLFVQKGRQLITPPLSEGALPGIIRAALLASGDKSGLNVTEGLIGRDLLAKADALFISNSVQLIVPAGFDATASEAQKNRASHYAKPCLISTIFEPDSLVFRLQNLTATIHAAFQINMVTQMQFTAIGVFDIICRPQCVSRPAHAALGRGGFSLRYSHRCLQNLLTLASDEPRYTPQYCLRKAQFSGARRAIIYRFRLPTKYRVHHRGRCGYRAIGRQSRGT